MEMLTGSLTCSFMDKLFVSKARTGSVMKVHSKNCKSGDTRDIITAMEIILHKSFCKDRNGIIDN